MAVPELNYNKKVSVCILHFNRMDVLIVTVGHVINSTYKNIEIIIVDNASDYFHEFEIRKLFPEIKIIFLKQNVGISGWNEAFKVASGDYFLVLDDDSYPDKYAIEKAVKIFSDSSNLGIIAAKVKNMRTGEIETFSFNKSPDFFVGCGAFISKEVYDKIGGFNGNIFIYLHELDYSARTYAAGFNICYIENILIYHNQSKKREYGKNKDPYLSSFRYYHYSASYFVFLISYFDWRNVCKYGPKWIVNRFLITLVYGFHKEFFLFIKYIITMTIRLAKKRNILPKQIQRFYRNGNVAFIDKDYFRKNER